MSNQAQVAQSIQVLWVCMDKKIGRRHMTIKLNENGNIPKSINIQYILVTNIPKSINIQHLLVTNIPKSMNIQYILVTNIPKLINKQYILVTNIPKSINIQYILVTNILTRTATSGHDDQHPSRSACFSALSDQNSPCSLSIRTLRIETFKGRFWLKYFTIM